MCIRDSTNAGHNPPYIIQPDDELICLSSRHGPVGGAMQGVSYASDRRTLGRGDTLFMFTDGITEAHDDHEALYGEQRLVNSLARLAGESVESLNTSLMADVDHFMNGAEQADDITILAYRYRGAKESSSVTVTAHRIWKSLDSTIEVNKWFDEFAEANRLAEKVHRKLNMVIDDLIMNIISYAFTDAENREVEVRLAIDAGKIEITFIDNGRPFNPFDEAKPDTSVPITDRDVGGLGIHLSRELADEASYQRTDDHNIVKLVVGLTDRQSGQNGRPGVS